MKLQGRLAQTFRTSAVRWAAAVLLAAGLVGWSGCKPKDSPPTGPGQPEEPPAEGASGSPGEGSGAKIEGPSAREVLDAMVQAYKAAESYADKGLIRFSGKSPQGEFDEEAPCVVAFTRPNKLRVQSYEGVAVADGEHLWAFVSSIRGTVLKQPLEGPITIPTVFSDQVLASGLAQGGTQGYTWVPVQLLLLLADDPLKTLLHDAASVERVPSKEIDKAACYGVRVERPDGAAVFWVDEKTSVLRQLDFPTEEVNQMLAGGQLRNFAIAGEFTDATLGGDVDPHAFEFQADADADFVEALVPPVIQRLGRQVPEFTFRGLDGKEITRESLAGKITVIDIWATWCGPCRESMPELEEVYQKYKDNPKVAFVAVSTDQAQTTDEQVQTVLDDLDVHVPIARADQQAVDDTFVLSSYPTTVILDGEGNMQLNEFGYMPGAAGRLEQRLEKLLAGKDLFRETVEEYRAQQQHYAEWAAKRFAEGAYWGPLAMEAVDTTTEIAEATQPQSLRIESLWKTEKVAAPGNILVVPQADGPPRVLVVSGGNAIVEVAPDGSVSDSHALEIGRDLPVTYLRTTKDADGKRWFAAAAMMGRQQVLILDDQLDLAVAYPEDALENRHAGLTDVEFGDLAGDGTPELCVGYWGVVGVQGVSLQGKRIWKNRELADVLRLAVVPAGTEGQSHVWCTNRDGTLVALDAQGGKVGEVSLPGRPVLWLASEDLDGDGQAELCGLSPNEEGDITAVGISPQGEELWSYPMPEGVHEYPCEQVVAGRLLPGDSAQWVLLGADGSIHVLTAAGEPVDRFNYGEALCGLATAHWDNRRVLLVSTQNHLDAWEVKAPGE